PWRGHRGRASGRCGGRAAFAGPAPVSWQGSGRPWRCTAKAGAVRYKDYAGDHKQKTMARAADEVLRRFLQHVLPRGLVKIRHYGLLANAQREGRLTLCRRLLLVATVAAALPRLEAGRIEPAQPRCCPSCGGTRLVCWKRRTAEQK